MAGSTLPVSLPGSGMGLFTALPVGTTNGAPLPGARPPDARGVEFYLPTSNDTVSIALSNDTLGAPTSAPTLVLPLVGPLILPFALTSNVSIYVTAKNGNPFFRYV